MDRILIEEASHERGIEIRSHLDNPALHKSAYPAISVVKPEPVLGGGGRAQFNHRPVAAHERVLYMQLRAERQNFSELFNGRSEKLSLGVIVAGKGSEPSTVPFASSAT